MDGMNPDSMLSRKAPMVGFLERAVYGNTLMYVLTILTQA
jgi:hypothetical protein